MTKNFSPSIRPLIIGIAGASGSGKSYFAKYLHQQLTFTKNVILSQDYYYRDRSDLPFDLREQINYDHPEAIEFELLKEHLIRLKNYEPICHPVYDFTVHNRSRETVWVGPAEVVIIDGILILASSEILPLFDYKIYIDTPLDICLIRRFRRDLHERGRSPESILLQYEKSVRPMFFKFVYPSRVNADIIVDGWNNVEIQFQSILFTIKKMIKDRYQLVSMGE